MVEAVRRVAKLSTVEAEISNWQLRRETKDLFGFIPLPCQKTIAVFYRGKVAAGFDLEGGAGLVVQTAPGRREVEVRLPPPRLLYTDVPPPELVVADGSLCNRITAEDYARLHRDARTAVEREALAKGLLARADAHARALLEEVVRPLGYTLVISRTGPAGDDAVR